MVLRVELAVFLAVLGPFFLRCGWREYLSGRRVARKRACLRVSWMVKGSSCPGWAYGDGWRLFYMDGSIIGRSNLVILIFINVGRPI